MSEEVTTPLEELMEYIRKTSDDFAAELGPDGDWEPMLFVLSKEKELSMVPMDMPENKYRNLFFGSFLPNIVKKICETPEAVIFLSSLWYLSPENGEGFDGEEWQGPMPSESPDRQEALFISGVSKDQELAMMGTIIRSDGPPKLEWMDEVTGGKGRMVGGLRRAVWG